MPTTAGLNSSGPAPASFPGAPLLTGTTPYWSGHQSTRDEPMHTFLGFCELWASPCPQMLPAQSPTLVCQPLPPGRPPLTSQSPSRLTPHMNTTALSTLPTAKDKLEHPMPTCLSQNSSVIPCTYLPVANCKVLQIPGISTLPPEAPNS